MWETTRWRYLRTALQHAEHVESCGVWTVVPPILAILRGGVDPFVREIQHATPATLAQRATPLQMTNQGRFRERQLVRVEIKGNHAASQQVGFVAAMGCDRAKLGGGRAYVTCQVFEFVAT
jgi:hypothetical protein